MRIISKKALREFWQRYPDAEQPLRAWHSIVQNATWSSPVDVTSSYPNTSIVAGNRAIFNIRGGHYRLVVAINYAYSLVYIRFVGTHAEYDYIDPSTI